MSTSAGPKVAFRCADDCGGYGVPCPGHQAQFVCHHTVNTFRLEVDGQVALNLDPGEWDAFLESYRVWGQDRLPPKPQPVRMRYRRGCGPDCGHPMEPAE